MSHCSRVIAAFVGVIAIPAQDPVNLDPIPGGSSVSLQQQQPIPAPVALEAYRQPIVLEPQIRAITKLHNSMPAPLVGLGIVVGLANTGSSERGSRQALLNFIRSQGLNLTIADVVAGNVALVSLTCQLPPFAKVGEMLDVKCSIIGDGISLRGGELLRAELRAVTGETYVVAQGALLVGGFSAQGTNAQVVKNVPTTGWVPNGGQVVKDLESSFFSESGCLELRLLNPSAFNAAAIAAGIRSVVTDMGLTVEAVDPTLVRIPMPSERRTNEAAIQLLNLIGNTRVKVENPSKVVIDQASGTVLAGEGVMISPCVVGLAELTIAIVNEDDVVQPNPFGNGDTAKVGRTRIEVQGRDSDLKPLTGGATVADLLTNLKTLGLTPTQLVAVFQALDSGHFLQAELEVK
jgi:flagellar P-ring protein precursor FlgI